MFTIEKLIRPNILALLNSQKPKEKSDTSKIRLHKNENAFGSPLTKWYHRYPDSSNEKLREALSVVKNVNPDNIIVSNGSSELLDAIFQGFCRPGVDNVLICPPTCPLYEKRANIHEVKVKKAILLDDFQLNISHMELQVNECTKIIWLCSPNNPTGNFLVRSDIETILNNFDGLVVIDEAYINYSRQKSFLKELNDYPNLIILQTMSVAWGLAGLQVDMAFASKEIIDVLNVVKQPNSINNSTEELCLTALEEVGQVNDIIKEIVGMRVALKGVVEKLPYVQKVYPSDANFLLVKMDNANEVYHFLLSRSIAVSNQTDEPYCENCLRITIGTEDEITKLVEALADYFVEKKALETRNN